MPSVFMKVVEQKNFNWSNMVEATFECLKLFQVQWIFGCANRNIYWIFKIGKKMGILNAGLKMNSNYQSGYSSKNVF